METKKDNRISTTVKFTSDEIVRIKVYCAKNRVTFNELARECILKAIGPRE